jgi:molecular chaperone DnaJ
MSTTSRDYYEILGVPRDADDETIKKAFRRLARELHPDVNPDDPSAEERFKEVAEAYKVLSEPDTRQLYDRHGHAGLRGSPGPDMSDFGSFQDIFDAFFGGTGMFGGRSGGPRRQAGDDHLVGTQITFVESALGVQKEVDVTLVRDCPTCEGTGGAPGTPLERCGRCEGQGEIRQVARGPFGQFIRASICSECHGEGQRPRERCPECRGARRTRQRSKVAVEVPAGIADGQRIRLPGRAHSGDPGAPAGDLYIEVAVTDDPRFERDGLDILTKVTIPVSQAMTGVTVTVPTVTGDTEIALPPGTQPYAEQVLRGKGFPVIQGHGRGDQRVVVEVTVPTVTSPEGRELLAQLAEHSEMEGEKRRRGRLRRPRR